MKTIAYIDGFNLYYGCLRRTGFKWLDLKALITSLVHANNDVVRIKYFTARVSGASDPDAPRRQQIYLNALGTFPEIEIYFGSFLSKTIWRPLVNLPIANRDISGPGGIVAFPPGRYPVGGVRPQTLVVGSYAQPGAKRAGRAPAPLRDAVIAEVHAMEEKGSDVNLATHLVNDAWKGLYDAAVVVSNDTDLVEPIRVVTQERKKQVYICASSQWGVAKPLANVSTYVRHINPGMLSSLPNPIPGTTITKPSSW